MSPCRTNNSYIYINKRDIYIYRINTIILFLDAHHTTLSLCTVPDRYVETYGLPVISPEYPDLALHIIHCRSPLFLKKKKNTRIFIIINYNILADFTLSIV